VSAQRCNGIDENLGQGVVASVNDICNNLLMGIDNGDKLSPVLFTPVNSDKHIVAIANSSENFRRKFETAQWNIQRPGEN
jgi:hypothetical protein